MLSTEDLLRYIEEEAGKCSYCGFCEHACPTLKEKPVRIYGPRGRVYIAYLFSAGEASVESAREAAYTCLLCGACVPHCPAQIDVPRLMRAVRALTRPGLASSRTQGPTLHASRRA